MATSLSVETLQMINSELDAEKNGSVDPVKTFCRRKNLTSQGLSSQIEQLNTNKKSVDEKLFLPSNYVATIHLNSIESKPEDREHFKIYGQIFDLISLFGKFIGVDLTYHWIPYENIMFWITGLLFCFTWFCIFYTQLIHIRNGEILRVLEACSIYGISISCTQKLLGYLKKHKQVLSLVYCIRKICLQTVCGPQADILMTNLSKTFRISKMYAVGVASCVLLFVACPFKSYFVDKELIYLLPLEIVFVNQTTYSGFLVGNGVMVIMGMFATLGMIMYGSLFIFCISMYSLQVNLIEQDLKDLDGMWTEDSTVHSTYKHTFLFHICNKIQDVKNYMDEVKEIFESKLFYYFCFNYLSQIICLFEIAKNQWLPGYAIASELFIEMMFYCIMGTQITVTDESLSASIYNTNWHHYDMQSQKILILLLHRSQQSNELSLGSIGPLNVVTGIVVVKSIYSYYTVLTELL